MYTNGDDLKLQMILNFRIRSQPINIPKAGPIIVEKRIETKLNKPISIVLCHYKQK